MRTRAYKTGFTLIEMVMVIAIIAILVSMVIRVARRIGDHSKERLCRSTIAILVNALEQFRDFSYEYKGLYAPLGLTFPLDCNEFQTVLVEPTLRDALYSPGTLVNIVPDEPIHDFTYSSSEALYYVLSQVPDCRKTLDKIDASLLTNQKPDGTIITIAIDASPALPFTRIVDPWGTTLRYEYYGKTLIGSLPDVTTKKTFPVITSAGPDKQFDTADDITNIK